MLKRLSKVATSRDLSNKSNVKVPLNAPIALPGCDSGEYLNTDLDEGLNLEKTTAAVWPPGRSSVAVSLTPPGAFRVVPG